MSASQSRLFLFELDQKIHQNKQEQFKVFALFCYTYRQSFLAAFK